MGFLPYPDDVMSFSNKFDVTFLVRSINLKKLNTFSDVAQWRPFDHKSDHACTQSRNKTNKRNRTDTRIADKVQMARKLKRSLEKPAFFKFLLGDFSQHLHIPPSFVERYMGRPLSKCVVRGPSGKSWAVELEERENGCLYFNNGWESFVKDHFLQEKDFLIFRYESKSSFDVNIYNKACCEKDLEKAKRRNGTSSDAHRTSEDATMAVRRSATDRVKGTSTGVISFKSKNSCFEVTLEKCRLYQILIPKEVARAEGILGKKTLTLLDPSKKAWNVKLFHTEHGRLLMTKGWAKCHRANQISVGDTVGFEFVKPTLARVHIFRSDSRSY